ncbi:MAG: hypothetical protein AAFR21_10395 [Pseudomonadota bacterium]
MTTASEARPLPDKVAPTLPHHLLFPTAMVATVIASLPLRFGSATPDVSWLIDMCARVLDGETAYIDIFETTPPVPMLLYMPGALLEKFAGIRAETAVICYAYLSYLGALWLSARLLPKQLEGLGPSHWFVILPASIFLFILTNDAFAQREGFAVAFTLPMICALIARAQTGKHPGILWRSVAIALAGIGAAIKPPLFAAPLLLCGGYVLFKTRNPRDLYSCGFIASAVVFAAVTAGTFAMFPAYFDGVYQMMRDIYVPLRHNFITTVLLKTVTNSIHFCLFFASFILLRPTLHRKLNETDRFFLLAAAGFFFAYLYQAKHFDYHVIPIAFFCFLVGWSSVLLALQTDITAPKQQSKLRLATILSAIKMGLFMVLCTGLFLSFDDDEPKLLDRSWAEDLDQPTAMSISSGYINGFPLAREINARWVNRVHSQWAVTYPEAVMQKQTVSKDQRTLFVNYQDAELNRTIAVVSEKKPEIIIHGARPTDDYLTEELLKRDPTLFDGYAVVAEDDVFRIWQRISETQAN